MEVFPKFSWAPAGVLRALLSPAQHIEGSKIIKTEKPWLAVKNYTVKEEELECYPNRDSLPYKAIISYAQKGGLYRDPNQFLAELLSLFLELNLPPYSLPG